jgi:hypothetical protein
MSTVGDSMDQAVEAAHDQMEMLARRLTQMLYPAMLLACETQQGCRVWGQAEIGLNPPQLLAPEEFDRKTVQIDRLQFEEVYNSMEGATPMERLDRAAQVLMGSAERYEAWTRFIEVCLIDEDNRPEGMTGYQLAKELLPQMLQAKLGPAGLTLTFSPGPFFKLWSENFLEPELLKVDESQYAFTRRIWATAAGWACTDLVLDFELDEQLSKFTQRAVKTSDVIGQAIIQVCDQVIPGSSIPVLNALDSLRAGK